MPIVPLSGKHGKGKFVEVDSIDLPLAMSRPWYPDSGGYPRNQRKGYSAYLHRLIVKPSDGDMVDHVNGKRLDCRRSNLRACNHQENSRNRPAPSHNTSGYKGVTMFKPRMRWKAEINTGTKCWTIGYFDNPEDAAGAYNTAALELFGEFAHLN